jgi:hydrogenase maturation protein HypF
LGVCKRNGYEGQCASALQTLAERAASEGTAPEVMRFVHEGNGVYSAAEIIKNARNAKNAKAFALGFHLALAEWILEACKREKERFRQVALSGGVFQNAFLLEETVARLEAQGFRVYFNEKVPPNDGGIALGQAFLALNSEEEL